MSVTVRIRHLAVIVRHCEAAYPNEGCGLLLGREANGDKIVEQIIPVEGSPLAEGQGKPCLIPPDAIHEGNRLAAEKALTIVGFFHSHPDGSEQPSDFDLEHAEPGFSYLITSVREGCAVSTTGWVLTEDRTSFSIEELKVTRES